MRAILFLLCLLSFLGLPAQRNYTEALQQGDAALRNGQYQKAIAKYFAAEAFDPDQKVVVRVRQKLNRHYSNFSITFQLFRIIV